MPVDIYVLVELCYLIGEDSFIRIGFLFVVGQNSEFF